MLHLSNIKRSVIFESYSFYLSCLLEFRMKAIIQTVADMKFLKLFCDLNDLEIHIKNRSGASPETAPTTKPKLKSIFKYRWEMVRLLQPLHRQILNLEAVLNCKSMDH